MGFSIAWYLFYSLMITLAVERFARIFFEKSRTRLPILIASYLLLFILIGIPVLSWHIPVVRQIIGTSAAFIITLNYKTSIIERIAYCVCCFINIGLFEGLLFTLVFQPHVPLDLHVASMPINVSNFVFIIFGLIIYFDAFLLSFLLKNIRKKLITSQMFLILAIVIPCFALIMLNLILLYVPRIIAITTITIIYGIYVLTLYVHNALSAIYEEKLKSDLQAQEKEYYLNQLQLMQESVEQAKSMRHDMKIHLSTAKDFAINDKAKTAAEYLSGLLGDINKNEIYSDTGNIAFDSIINFKLNNAKIEDFKPEIRLLIPPQINVEIADIVTILGNLLDNALDAVTNISTPEKMLTLNIELSKDSLFIKIDNTFDGVVKYDNGKDGDASYIITRKTGSGHGYGLKNIRKSVEKYNGHLDISHKGNVFSVGVLLYVDDVYHFAKLTDIMTKEWRGKQPVNIRSSKG